MIYDETTLRTIFQTTRFERQLDRAGYVQFRRWKIYGEYGLARQTATIWLTAENLTITFQDQPLAHYAVSVSSNMSQLTDVREPQLIETAFRSPQLLAPFVTLFVTTQPILAPKVATRSSPTLVPLPLPSAIPAGPFTVTRPLLTGQLVFATLRNQVGDGGCGRLGIYLLAGSATPSRHLADGCNPVLSPNGQLVTYVRAGQLWVAATTGGGERSVSGDGVVDGKSFPAWSADSGRIAFVMEREGRTDIYRVNTDGSQLVRLTNSAAFTDGWTAFEPVWSPDGQHLAMIESTKPWGPEANWDVYVVNSDGSGLTRLTNDPAREGPIAWSPDGTRLLFWSERDGGHINVYLMQTDGRQVTQVTHGAYDSRASWSPDGTQIALASTEDGQIYVASIENHTITQITTGLTHSYNPIWSDDGQYIFFGAFADTGDSAWIYSVRPDGQELAPLITTTKWLQWTQH